MTEASVGKADMPLTGYTVLDLAGEEGIICGCILAELGAEVIKIEPPGGDPGRNVGPFYGESPDPEKSLFWYAYNAEKKSITLNIETSNGQAIFKKLLEQADFVVESFPPGYMARQGLSYEELIKINSKIIMTSITYFGQEGPYRDYKASDIVLMAMCGLMNMCGDVDRQPLRIGIEQAYGHGGMMGALGSLIALYYRNLTGEGQHVDVSIEECLVWLAYLTVPYYSVLGKNIPRAGSKMQLLSLQNELIFPCKDGFIMHRVGTGRLLGAQEKRLVELIDSEGMAEDLKEVKWMEISFADLKQDELTHWEEVVGRYFLKHTKSELYNSAIEKGIMLAPIFDIKDICEYQQLQSRGYWIEIDHPPLDTTITYPGALFKSSEISFNIVHCAPTIGEHNNEIYVKELGFSSEELMSLKEAGIV